MPPVNPARNLSVFTRLPVDIQHCLQNEGIENARTRAVGMARASQRPGLVEGRILRHTGDHLGAANLLSHAYAANQLDWEIAAELSLTLIDIGRQDDGLVLLRHSVEQRPDLVWAVVPLANALYRLGDAGTALYFLDRAKLSNPLAPAVWSNAGQIRAASNQLSAATDDLVRAIALAPDDDETLIEYACLLAKTGRSQEAQSRIDTWLAQQDRATIQQYQQALVGFTDVLGQHKEPGKAAAILTKMADRGVVGLEGRIGLSFLQHREADKAMQWLGRADAAKTPSLRQAWLLAQILEGATVQVAAAITPSDDIAALIALVLPWQRHDKARAFLKTLASQQPTTPNLPALLGAIDLDEGRYANAAAHLEQAWRANPKDMDIANNYIVALAESGKPGEAADIAQHLRQQQSLPVDLLFNTAMVLQRGSMWQASIDLLHELLAQQPNHPPALQAFVHAKAHLCDWQDFAALTRQFLDMIAKTATDKELRRLDLFALNGLPVPSTIKGKIARLQADHLSQMVTALPKRQWDSTDRPIHIGWISPDFRDHSLGKLILPIIQALPGKAMTHSGWSLSRLPADSVTDQFIAAFDHWHDIAALPSEAAARLIRQEKVDILIDLAGPTRGSRPDILAQKPAPVQLHAYGFGETCGGGAIDGLITDKVSIPPDMSEYCAEKLYYLPHSFMAGAGIPDNPELSRRNEGLPDDALVFANFNSHAKFHPDGFDLWARILKQTGNGVLWLLEGNAVTRQNLLAEARARGIEDRLIFANRVPWLHHRQRLALADICLDCLYHTGGATTVDALWAGLPVVTLAGQTQNARVSASCLQDSATQPDLVAKDQQDFIDKALHLARNQQERLRLRQILLEERHQNPLFNAQQHAENLTALLHHIAAEQQRPAKD